MNLNLTSLFEDCKRNSTVVTLFELTSVFGIHTSHNGRYLGKVPTEGGRNGRFYGHNVRIVDKRPQNSRQELAFLKSFL